MASFQAKIGWERPRQRENENYRFVPFLLDVLQKIPKKFKKLKNTIMTSFQAKIGWKMPGKRECKIIIPFRCYLTRNRKFQKNSKKHSKN